jgi:hypothetical protein
MKFVYRRWHRIRQYGVAGIPRAHRISIQAKAGAEQNRMSSTTPNIAVLEPLLYMVKVGEITLTAG